ncbi:MAG: helix-turn-helix transcriptional regulator [Bacteroidia bacterium]|nr:helix-turn-helix transcriptional regulator [Bacteroidia bacterium]
MRKNNYKTAEELENKYFGEKGTPERDEYEFELKMELLSEALKQLRKEKNLTQEELGKLIGVQKAQISKLENSVTNVTLTTILKVFKALKAKINIKIEIDKYRELAIS